MIKRIINKKIQTITTTDIEDFALKNQINLTSSEKESILNFIRQHPQLIYENLNKILATIHNEVPSSLYQKIEPLVISYYQKYKIYL